MASIDPFAQQVQARLAAARTAPQWDVEEARQYMDELQPRRERFKALAAHLITVIIRPRLEIIASHFPNAGPPKSEPAGRCVCWFGYCERFPATVKVELAVEHDVRYESVFVRYELSMMPALIKCHGNDRITLPLGQVDEDLVAAWIEKRLLEFLDVYLQIDRGLDDFEEDVAIDPVCGMRIRRSQAAAFHDYRGTTYFFCSPECRQRFAAMPTDFVTCKPS